ncbi:TlpA family protein disulfide reductase [Streptomyces hebeiensis]
MNSGRAPRRPTGRRPVLPTGRRLRAVQPTPRRRPRGALLSVAAVAVSALTLSACSGGGTSGGGGDTNFVTNTGGISTVAKGERKPVNTLAGETLEGEKLDVADLKGKIVVLNVWGSWCGPCRAEAPHFAKVSEETEAKGVAFVGINTRDPNKGPALAFEEDYGVRYPSLYDPTGKLIVTGFPKGNLNPQAIPSTIVLDREGKVAARSLMALDETKLRKMIDPLIAEK